MSYSSPHGLELTRLKGLPLTHSYDIYQENDPEYNDKVQAKKA